MNKYIMSVALLIMISFNHVIGAAKCSDSSATIDNWLDIEGMYFDDNCYQKIADNKIILIDRKLCGYIDTLMTWGIADISSPIKFFGGTFVLSSKFKINLVGIEHQLSDDCLPSMSIWALIINSAGYVVNSECLFNRGENRVYKDRICSILADNGRMVIQQTFDKYRSTAKYLNWKDLYEDGTPTFYFQCYDELWTQGSGSLMCQGENSMICVRDYLDPNGIVNLIKTDYLRTDDLCNQIAIGHIELERKYLLQALKTEKGNDYIILLENTSDKEIENKFIIRIVKSDIYHMDMGKVVGESEVICLKELRNIKIIIRASRSDYKIKVKKRSSLPFRFWYKMKLY